MSYFGYITNLIDVYIETKGIRQQTELTNAFIQGFCSSFLINFRVNAPLKSSNRQNIDNFTYEFLMKKIAY